MAGGDGIRGYIVVLEHLVHEMDSLRHGTLAVFSHHGKQMKLPREKRQETLVTEN
jgi:phage gp45-like